MIPKTFALAAVAAGAMLATLQSRPDGLPATLTIEPTIDSVTALSAVTFSGRITRAGQPVAHATVRVLPWGEETRTGTDGRYSIAVTDAKVGDAAIIRVSTGGFADVTRTTTASSAAVTVDIDLSGGLPVETTIERKTNQRQEMEKAANRQLERVTVTNTTADASYRAAMPAAPLAASGAGACCDAIRYSDPDDFNTEAYAAIDENPFLGARTNPLSTFSIDVDRASYANVRRFLRDGTMPPKDAVRIEELVNYFAYDDPAPDGGDTPFTVTTELAHAPWQPGHHLLRVALKAREVSMDSAPASNLVFLLDVSGSMSSPDKLPLLKRAFGLLVNELRPEDRVAIVVYAGAAGVVLESTEGSEKERILEAIERLEAGGSTAGGAGIRLAYDIARRHHIQGGNNRVILATDGDFNVGASSDAEMMRLIEEKRRQGTFLTVLGFGTGNLKDSKMELVANRGNGNYAYIDSPLEARKVLIEEMGGTLLTVAKDVKIQVEFNPTLVKGHRLIGYENRLLAAEDFNDDRKDAGELGAGHSVTALYEVVPAGADTDVEIRGTDPLRYQDRAETRTRAGGSAELAFVKLRWKKPDGDTSSLLEHPVPNRTATPSTDLTFAASVAAFGMLLRQSEHAGNATWDSVLAGARAGRGPDRGDYRAAFIDMVEQARRLASPIAAGQDGDSPRR